MSTIFVAIASYNEEELYLTIDSIYKNASYPNNIYAGVWEHRTDNHHTDLSSFPNVKHAKIIAPIRLGVGAARLNALTLYSNEDFILQIDAHSIFEPDWDIKIINKYTQIIKEKNLSKIIISSYAPIWYYNEEHQIIKNKEAGKFLALCTLEYPKPSHWGWEPATTQDYIWEWESEDVRLKGYLESYKLTAQFLFTIGEFVSEVMPDPYMTWGGEETTTSLRAWTRGYRIFGIKEPILYHYHKKGSSKTNLLDHWDNDHYTNYFLHLFTHEKGRVSDIFSGKLLGYWGAPTMEKLQEYNALLPAPLFDMLDLK